VVFARGHLRSSSVDDIVKRAEIDLDSGAREIWLTGQDMAAYGRDIGVDLVALLNELCQLSGDYMIRVGMMTPNLTLDMLDDLVDAFQNEHVFKFVHLPVQSGSDRVLKRMNRLYTTNQFRSIVETFRNAIPQLTVATDIICGFPGETYDDFEGSLDLIEEAKPDVVNISKFFLRPRTAAEKMNSKVPPAEVSDRSRRMTQLVKRISSEKNRAWLKWKGRILVDEHGKQPDTFIGRNFAYKPIVVKSESESLFGTFVDVRVTKAFQTYLEAEIIN
jgi:MiaB/RimO family radical SAM methylthiotransferase